VHRNGNYGFQKANNEAIANCVVLHVSDDTLYRALKLYMPQFQSRVLDVTRTHRSNERDARVDFSLIIYISILLHVCALHEAACANARGYF